MRTCYLCFGFMERHPNKWNNKTGLTSFHNRTRTPIQLDEMTSCQEPLIQSLTCACKCCHLDTWNHFQSHLATWACELAQACYGKNKCPCPNYPKLFNILRSFHKEESLKLYKTLSCAFMIRRKFIFLSLLPLSGLVSEKLQSSSRLSNCWLLMVRHWFQVLPILWNCT